MPKPFSAAEKELITRRLLEQGEKQFSLYGLHKTNIEEIARAAGISKGAFYAFYASKEALFMDVVEQVEVRVRAQILDRITQPGASPRDRLLQVLRTAFELFESVPILQVFTGSDFDLLFHRVPAEKISEHFAADRLFAVDLVAACRSAGISIQVSPEQIIALLYPLVIAFMHKDDLARVDFRASLDILLQLVAAYALGEIELPPPAIASKP
jgi:AcrR family transcriptional regulator